MEDQKQSAGSTNIDAGSEDAGKNAEVKGNKDQYVRYESHDKLLGQHKAAKAENAELKEKLAALQTEEQKRVEQELAAQGEWKLLVEAKEKKIAELEEKYLTEAEKAEIANSTLTNAQKIQAVCDKLPGKIRNSKYYQYIDINQVALNPETGEVDEASVQTVANAFMEEHKELVDTTHIGRLPAGAHGSHKEPALVDVPLKEMRAKAAEMAKAKISKLNIM